MKKHLLSVILALVMLLAFGGTATLAAITYSIPITVTETGTASYDMLSCNVTANIDYMASSGVFAGAEGLDTRVLLGTGSRPHMLADDRIMFAVPMPTNSTKTLSFTTGSANLTHFPVIVGYSENTSSGGYVETADADNLEPSDNFTISQTGWINTDNGTDKNLINKDGVYSTFVSPTVSGNITSIIGSLDWISPTGFVDPDTKWADESNIFDDNTASYSTGDAIAATSWSSFIELTRAAVVDNVRYWYTQADLTQIDIDLYYNGGWQHEYSGAIGAENTWNTVTVSPIREITAVQISFYNGAGSAKIPYFHEFDITGSVSVTAIDVSSSNHTVTTTANTTHLWIDIDGVTQDTAALANISVPNNSANWTLMQNNSIAYADNTTFWIDGTKELWYRPTSIITPVDASTATLLDRTNAYNHGVIHWGGNPAGVDMSLGILVSDYEAYSAPVAGASQDIAPTVTPDLIPSDVARRALLDDDPFIDIAETTEEVTEGRLPVLLQYWAAYLAIAIFLFIWTYKQFNHLIISGIAFCVPIGYGISQGIIDFWVIAALILWLIGCAMFENRQIIG